MELAPGMEPLEMVLSWPALHVMDAIHVVVCVLKKKSLGQVINIDTSSHAVCPRGYGAHNASTDTELLRVCRP